MIALLSGAAPEVSVGVVGEMSAAATRSLTAAAHLAALGLEE
jgi:hypothetical protein